MDIREKIIDSLLGKQLLPAYPVIVLAILQALDATRNLNTASGSYGELYEALITDRLASISHKPTDLGTKYTLISRLAYSLCESESNSLTLTDLQTVCDRYFDEYGIRLDSGQLVEDTSVR